jgi:hypothetical protein
MSGETEVLAVRKVNIRKSHPALYRALMTLGCMYIALALNFWFAKPAFNPYDWPKEFIGAIFSLLGFSLIVFLNIFRELRIIRIVLAVSVSFMFFWGFSNAQQFFAGKASLQLPLLYVAVSIMQIPLLIESPVNPMTEKK